MRKLAVFAIATLLATAFSAAGAAEKNHHRRHVRVNVHKSHPVKPAEKPVTRLPVPPDTFRA